MSVASHLAGTEDDMHLVQEVVRKHLLPDYISSFDVEFGEFDSEPALWVRFKLKENRLPRKERLEKVRSRFGEMNALAMAVRADLLRLGINRWPYIGFTSSVSNLLSEDVPAPR